MPYSSATMDEILPFVIIWVYLDNINDEKIKINTDLKKHPGISFMKSKEVDSTEIESVEW